VNLYGRAVGPEAQVPKAQRHDHLPGAQGYFNATALQAGRAPLWVCEGAFDALALLAAGVSRVAAIFGVQGWRWDWAREVRELVFALDADAAGQQQWRQLARQAALRGKQVRVLPTAAGACRWWQRSCDSPTLARSIARQRRTSSARVRTSSVATHRRRASMGQLSGQVAAVTGGAAGIGEATVRRLIAEGAQVVCADRDVAPGQRGAAEIAASGGHVVFVETHVEQEADVAAFMQRAVDHFGQLNIWGMTPGDACLAPWSRRAPRAGTLSWASTSWAMSSVPKPPSR
jgi:hypothetical protein